MAADVLPVRSWRPFGTASPTGQVERSRWQGRRAGPEGSGSVTQGGRRSGLLRPFHFDAGGGAAFGVDLTWMSGVKRTLDAFRCGAGFWARSQAGSKACITMRRTRHAGALARHRVVEPPHCIGRPSAGVDVGWAREGSANVNVGRRVPCPHEAVRNAAG